MAKITIVGAGLSGLVAGINLAKQGREVEIIEASKEIGGSTAYHPSVHGTPIFPEKVSADIGVDITPYFFASQDCRLHVGKRSYHAKPNNYYLVERGSRPTSLDYGLFKEAEKYGVKVHFSTPVTDLKDLPPGSIIATGLDERIYKAIGLPYIFGDGMAIKTINNDPKMKNCIYAWFGKFSRDYAYMGEANDILFILLFDRTVTRLSPEQKEAFKEILELTTGITSDDWITFTGCIPKFNRDTLRLFYQNKILAGTISGMMDPGALFGIHGALLSGKVAATAVLDPEAALKEFEFLNKYYRRALYIRQIVERLPVSEGMMNFGFSHPKLVASIGQYFDRSIPGYDRSIFKDWMGIPQ